MTLTRTITAAALTLLGLVGQAQALVVFDASRGAANRCNLVEEGEAISLVVSMGVPSARITFDRHAASVINGTTCIQTRVRPNTVYLGYLTVYPIPGSNAVDFTLSIDGLSLAGSGTVRTLRNFGGEIRVQESRSLDCPILSGYKIQYYFHE